MINDIARKSINVDTVNNVPVATVKELDDFVLKLSLMKYNTPFDATGQTVTLGVKAPSGLFEQNTDITINKEQIDIKLKTGIVAKAGTCAMELKLVDGTGTMTTASFFIVVNPKILSDGAVQATNEFDIFKKTVTEVEKDYNSLRKIMIDENNAANLQNQVNKTNASLEEKIQQGQVKVSDINKNYGKLDQTFMSDEFLQQIVGSTPINSTPADYSITEKKLAIPVLIGNKSKNLFDKNSILKGYIDKLSGNRYEIEGWSAIEKIPVISGMKLVNSHNDHQGAFFDSNKNYISGFDSSINPIQIPTNASYVSLSVANGRIDITQFEYGTVSTSYESYGVKIEPKTIPNKSITPEMVTFSVVDVEQVSIIVKQNGTGDFTNINEAIESIKDSSKMKVYNVYIYEGVYDIFTNLTSSQLEKGINLPNYVNLIGVGRKEKIILSGEHSTSATQKEVELRSTLNIDKNNNLKNITVTARNCRYAVHADNSNTFQDYEWNVENCDFIHKGNDNSFTWQNIIAWGSGSASGAKEYFKNCRFKGNAGYTNHNNPNFEKDTYQEFDNCIFEGQLGGMCIQFISMDSNVKNKIIMKGCKFSGNITLQNNGNNPYEFEISGYNNTSTQVIAPSGVFVEFSDDLNISVANKPINRGQCVKMYYNQCEPLVDGGKEEFFGGICLKNCLANETCYVQHRGYIDLSGILDGLHVGDYVGVTNGVLSKVNSYSNSIGRIVNGNVMRFY